MKFLENILLQFLDNKNNEKLNLEEAFTNLGFEVEEIIPQTKIENVLVGKVLEANKHPNADKLKFCKVESLLGVTDVVCGGVNVSEGQYIVYAPSGSNVRGITLEKKNLRGIESNGMILSIQEILDLKNNVVEFQEQNNIFTFLFHKPLDADVKKELNINGNIYDLTILNDRKYALSYLAMAREISAHYNFEFKIEKLFENNDCNNLKSEMDSREIKLLLSKETNGIFYSEVVLQNAYTPLDIKLVLYQNNITPRNTIRDLIAYVGLITGNVTYFVNKETFEFKTKKNFLNDIDIFNDDVIQTTQNEGLLVAYSTSYSDMNGKASNTFFGKIQSLGTNSEYLKFSLSYLIKMAKDIGYIKKSSLVVGKEKKRNLKIIELTSTYLDQYSGQHIILDDLLKEKLQILGFNQIDESNYLVPHYREDVNTKQDMIEEIIRLYGINNINSQSINVKDSYIPKKDYQKELIYRITNLIVKYNFSEIKTYHLIESKYAEKYNYWKSKKILKIKPEYNFKNDTLRTSLFKSLLDTHRFNYRNNVENINLFEISNLNINKETNLYLGLIHDDRYFKENPILATKQILIELFKEFGVDYKSEITFVEKEVNIFDKNITTSILYKNEEIGIIGKVSAKILFENKYIRLDKVKNTLYYLEICLDFLEPFTTNK